MVDEIQTHSESVIEHCYQNFLLENNDTDDREYVDATDWKGLQATVQARTRILRAFVGRA